MDDKSNSQKGLDEMQENSNKQESKTVRKRKNSSKVPEVKENIVKENIVKENIVKENTKKTNSNKETTIEKSNQISKDGCITIEVNENSSIDEIIEFNQLDDEIKVEEKKKLKETAQIKSKKSFNIKNITPLLNKINTFLRRQKNKENVAMLDIKNAFKHIHPRKVMFLFFACLIAIYLLTGIFIVNPGEQGVIRRFGAVLPQTFGEGIHYRLPYPIDRVQIVNTSEVRRADIGMNLPEHMHESDTPQSVQLLTGDENIITSEAIVHYQVKDAAKFLYNVNSNDEQLVRSSVEASLVKLMSNMAVDDILSTEKVQAQNYVLKTAQEMLDKYDSGILLTAFNIQSINPPNEVAEAFRDVNAAKEDKEKEINDAKGYYNSLLPEARAKANTMTTQAESYRAEEINQASGEAQKFESMLAEYQNNSKIYTKDTTKYRLFLETLDKILPKMKKYILDSSDNSIDLKLLDSNKVNLTTDYTQ